MGTDASKNLVSLAVATYPSLTELSYIKGLTSAAQTQLGGKADTALHAKYPEVLFLGERPYGEIADNQQAGDVLVLPTSSRSIVGMRFTSPLKLFTYMASGVPIVASDVSSTREVLGDKGAFWFTADDAESLAKAIREAVNDPQGRERAQVALGAVRGYTWDARAQAILAFV